MQAKRITSLGEVDSRAWRLEKNPMPATAALSDAVRLRNSRRSTGRNMAELLHGRGNGVDSQIRSPHATLRKLASQQSVRHRSMSTPDDSLAAALARHQIDLSAEQIALLERYCRALWAWNEKLNLTRHTDFERFVSRDVVDSRALEQLLEPGEHVLDVGTGGGLPGVVLAILRPDLKVSLSD